MVPVLFDFAVVQVANSLDFLAGGGSQPASAVDDVDSPASFADEYVTRFRKHLLTPQTT